MTTKPIYVGADVGSSRTKVAILDSGKNLLGYAIDSGNVVPELATGCTANEDSTVWTCALREGVVFHDGSSFDANDVVASWSAGIDASNPNHIGNTGAFEYYSYLWNGLMNAEE